jgi:hypothetical protein
MSAAQDAITEITAELEAIAPVHEGLRDYALLDIQPATKAEVDAAIAVYDRRVALLEKTRTALEELVSDGHPGIPTREISQAAFMDLQENKRTIDAALSRFASNAAVELGLQAGVVGNKGAGA